jgi:hypothetical protein
VIGRRAQDLERELTDAMRLVGVLVLRLGGRVELSSAELAEMADRRWDLMRLTHPDRDTVELRCVRQELLATVAVSVGVGAPMVLGRGDGSDVVALLRQVADEIEGKKESDSGS